MGSAAKKTFNLFFKQFGYSGIFESFPPISDGCDLSNMTKCDQTHNLRYANLYTLKAEAEKEFSKQKIMLSSNFKWDLNCNYQRCDYDHPLVCHLSQMSTKLSSESCLLNKSACLAPPLGITQFIIV
jgi:hypothetical protein